MLISVDYNLTSDGHLYQAQSYNNIIYSNNITTTINTSKGIIVTKYRRCSSVPVKSSELNLLQHSPIINQLKTIEERDGSERKYQ